MTQLTDIVRRLLVPVLCTVAYVASASTPGIVDDSIRALFDGRATDDAEGVWHIDDGATVVITRNADGYDIVSLANPDLRIAPGTRIGTAVRSNGSLKAMIASDTDDSDRPVKEREFSLKVTDGGKRLELIPSRKMRVELWLFYRLLFSASIRKEKAPGTLSARRLYPALVPGTSSVVL